MEVTVALTRLGGCVATGQLRRVVSGHAIKRAVRDGEVVRLSRGRYALPLVETHRREAHRICAALSHLSAAMPYGWPVKTPPDQPWVTVRRKRHLDPVHREGLHVVWRDLAPQEVDSGVTAPLRTVLDCAVRLPFDEALAVADSALRSGLVRPHELLDSASALRGVGSPKARAVAAAAHARAANPFESVLRAICLSIPGLDVQPQAQITGDRGWAIVDLADERLHLVIEAEGFEFHGTRRGLVRDCRRYTEIAVLGRAAVHLGGRHAQAGVGALGDHRLVAQRRGARTPVPPARQAPSA